MSFSVGLIMVLASVWIAYLASSNPRRGLAWRICRSSAPLWGGYVSIVLCLVYSAGMALSDLLAFGAVSFWLGLNLFYSSCFWVIPAAVVFSALVKAVAERLKVAEAASAPPTWFTRSAILKHLLLLGIGFYASLYEPNTLRLTTVHLTSPKLPPASELRLVHLSDLHINRLGIREKRVLRLIRAARPDLILLTGDYLARPKAAPQVEKFFTRLYAPSGVFAVPGAAEDHTNLSSILGTEVTLLRDEGVSLEVRGSAIRISGVDWDVPNLRRAFVNARASDFTILLSHSPRIIHSRPPADLLLAGQSHGGQVGIPRLRDAIISHLRGDPRYRAGLFRRGSLTMFVSRGLGMEGGDAPRLRFLAPPEVTLIAVKGTGKRD